MGGEGEGRGAKSQPKLWTSQRAQRFAECKEITRTKRRGGITVRTKRGAKRLDCQKSIAREGPKGRKSCVGGEALSFQAWTTRLARNVPSVEANPCCRRLEKDGAGKKV